MLKNRVVIDFSRGALKIDKKVIGFKKLDSNTESMLDERLVNSLVLLNAGKEGDEYESIKFIDNYSKSNESFTFMETEEAVLGLKEGVPIIQTSQYSIPYKYIDKGKKEIKRLLEEDIIEYSTSSYTSPGFFVKKMNGDLRLVVAYQKINEYIIDDAFPIPNLEECVYKLGGAKIFSCLDLKNGFNQVVLTRESRKYTSFVILGQQYQYKRIPFGIKSGPKLFQRRISMLLKDIPNCFVYIDDIVIFDQEVEKHDESLLKVLQILYDHKVKINFQKSEFFKNEINILGYTVNGRELKIDTKFTDNKIFKKEFKTKKDIQRLVGLLNWYRRYIPMLSTRITQITHKLKKETKNYSLSFEDKKVLKEICEEIKTNNSLQYPDYTKKFVLHTDACEVGCGSVLVQEDRIIGYFSKKFSASELNYSIVEKEFLAIVLSMIHFEDIVQGFYIEIFTDSRNCTFVPQNKMSPRMYRWSLLLNQFNYTLKSIEGKENIVADSISRCCYSKNMEYSDHFTKIVSQYAHKNSTELPNIPKEKIVIEGSNGEAFLSFLHEWCGHKGITVMYYSIKDYFYIKGLLKKLKKITESCKICQQYKITNSKIKNIPFIAKATYETVCSDIFGPFSTIDFQHNMLGDVGYILTITDVYSRFTSFYLLEKVGAKDIIKGLKDFMQNSPNIKRFVSDNGRQYVSKTFRSFLKEQNIEQLLIPPYTPSSNGISEGINKAVAFALAIGRADKSLEEIIKDLNFKHNINFNTRIKASPFEILYGYSFFDPLKRVSFKEPISNNSIDDSTGRRWLIGDIVVKKNKTAEKLDRKYGDETRIIDSGRRNRWVLLEGDKNWSHVKDLKLIKRG